MRRSRALGRGIAALLSSAVAVGVLAAQAPPYVIRSLAGNNPSGDGRFAAAAIVATPTSVVADTNGDIYIAQDYVAQNNTGSIRRVTRDGIITTIAKISSPSALALDHSGSLFVSSLAGCYIYRVTLDVGAVATVAGDGQCRNGPDGSAASSSINYPEGLAFDLQGRLLIAELLGRRVRRMDLTSGIVKTIAGTGSGTILGGGVLATETVINGPWQIALDASGNIYFTDQGDCLVRKVEGATGLLRTVAGTSCGTSGDGGTPLTAQLKTPRGLTVSLSGNLLHVGTLDGRIRQINLDTNRISTYAGTGTVGFSGDGGPATLARMFWPTALAFDRDGSLLVADYLGSRIRKIDPAAKITTLAGVNRAGGDGGPALAAYLNSPTAVALDGRGGIWISDSGNRRIRFLSKGVLTTFAGSNSYSSSGDGGLAIDAGLDVIRGIAVDSAGTVYIAENTGKLRRISGGVISRVGTTSYDQAAGIALDPSQRFLYVPEFNASRVSKVDLGTGIATTYVGFGVPGAGGISGNDGDGPATQRHLNRAGGVAVDGAGNLYVSDVGNYLIRRISPAGAMVTIAGNGLQGSTGDGGRATAASISPSFAQLAADAAGNVFFAESAKIRRIDAATGLISTVAGGTVSDFSGDAGPALAARLSQVAGLASDAQGNVYVTDQGNEHIRVLSPPTTAPRIAAAIAAANFGAAFAVSPGTWIEIYGEKLSPTTRQWAGGDFNGAQAPTSLDGVKVLIGNKQAAIDLISEGQINAQVPDGIPSGLVTVQVVNSNGASDPVPLTSADRTPALFAPPSFTSGGKNFVGAVFADLATFVGKPSLIPGLTFRPAKAGDRIILYGIGFGPGTPAIPSGTIASRVSPLPNVDMRIGGISTRVDFAGLVQGFVGLYQFNVVVPAVAAGDALVTISVNGVPLDQTLFLTVQ